MKINDLELVIENPSGSYKKFADTLEEYPILGVTYPTHYGYIKGYKSEDGEDLDVFLGNGDIFGVIQVNRTNNGVEYFETKTLLGINQNEYNAIETIFKPVIKEMKKFDSLDDFLLNLATFKAKE